MSGVNDFLEHAELAFGAYADLSGPVSDQPSKLREAGFSSNQAGNFAENWQVVAQYDGKVEETYIDEFGEEHTFLNPTGLSATVFENDDGKRYLAIRGTESSFPELINDWATNIIDIGLLGTAEHQAQYAALSDKVQEWLDDGTLQSGFSVAGHSLGGFLATSLALEYEGDVADAYIYNAPGLTGVTGMLAQEAIANALMPGQPFTLPPADSIHNIVAARDPVSEVGLPVSQPITVQTESNANPVHNHGMGILTDALAVYDLFSRVDSGASMETLSTLLLTGASKATARLESAVSTLGRLFGEDYSPLASSRDSLYQHLAALRETVDARTGPALTLVLAADKSAEELEGLANSDMAWRYALTRGDAFAVTGDESLFDEHNANGELDLYDAATGEGQLTEDYLADRAAFLETRTTLAEGATPTGDERIEYHDLALGQQAFVQSAEAGASRRIVFGSDGADRLAQGGEAEDHLYGGDGNDLLEGAGGADRLEGGHGYDTYLAGADDTILDTDREGRVRFGDRILGGGRRQDDGSYISADGQIVYDWSTADSTLTVTGAKGSPPSILAVKHAARCVLCHTPENKDLTPPNRLLA